MGKWVKMSDFSLSLPDRPGELSRFAAKLRAADVSLLGLWGYGGDGEFARFYCVPESAEQFRAFTQSAEVSAKEGTTFYFSAEDDVGALVRVLEEIASVGINLHAIQTISAQGRFGCFVWAEPKDWETLVRLVS